MATIKKIRRAQGGLSVSASRRCRIDNQGRRNCGPKSEEYKPGKMPRYSRKQQREMDTESERVMSGRKGKDPGMWHKEWDSDESIPSRLKSGLYKEKMKKGGKISAKKSPVKKAKSSIKQSKKKK